MDWTGLSVLAAVVLGAIGYIARQVARLEDHMNGRFDRVEVRIDRLEERYIRFLENR